ncbi:MAG: DUF2062 domain-containing protein [Bacteroidota bacterium]|nr:DUF2062 domain-containing protein [Bacteroidota bacterium]
MAVKKIDKIVMGLKDRQIGKFLDRALLSPLLDFLKQGVSPKKLALSVALGLMLGTFPVLGSTTLLCTAAAIAFRLNIPAIQMINFFSYPLQLLLFIPFIRAGEFLFNQPPISLNLVKIFTMIQTDILGAISLLWLTNVRAIVAWVLIAPLISIALYYVLVPVFRQLVPEKTT